MDTPAGGRRSGGVALLRAGATVGTVLLVGVLWAAVAWHGSPVDSLTYVAAGQRLNAGHALYSLSAGDWAVPLDPPYWTVPLLSPPIAGVLARPFALFGTAGIAAWWVLMGMSLTATICILAVRLPFITFALVAVLADPIRVSLDVGNLNSLILAGLVAIWWLTMVRGRDAAAGAVLGPLVALKLVPALTLIWLLGLRRWRAATAALAAIAMSGAVSLLGAGLDAHLAYLGVVSHTYGPGLAQSSLGGITHSTALAALATIATIAAVLATRARPALSFVIAVVGLLVGSPVINHDWPVLLLAVLAPIAWPIRRSRTSEFVDRGICQTRERGTAPHLPSWAPGRARASLTRSSRYDCISMPEPAGPEPLVAVIIPALNEAGKIGRVLDKIPRDGRFEAIVVDDGSTDGTGDEARTHCAAVVVRHEVRGGVGAAIRDGWKAGLARNRPYLALVSGDDQHEPAELAGALDRLIAGEADYVQGSRWMQGGHVVGAIGGRGFGTRVYSVAFSILAFHRVTDATNGFRVFRSELLRDPSIDLDQTWLDSYDLEPYVLYKVIRGRHRVMEYPVTVRYHAAEGYTKMRGIRDWWRLFRPAFLLRFGVKR
jgi:dolichol-phosphate mannosyltransferase